MCVNVPMNDLTRHIDHFTGNIYSNCLMYFLISCRNISKTKWKFTFKDCLFKYDHFDLYLQQSLIFALLHLSLYPKCFWLSCLCLCKVVMQVSSNTCKSSLGLRNRRLLIYEYLWTFWIEQAQSQATSIYDNMQMMKGTILADGIFDDICARVENVKLYLCREGSRMRIHIFNYTNRFIIVKYQRINIPNNTKVAPFKIVYLKTKKNKSSVRFSQIYKLGKNVVCFSGFSVKMLLLNICIIYRYNIITFLRVRCIFNKILKNM